MSAKPARASGRSRAERRRPNQPAAAREATQRIRTALKRLAEQHVVSMRPIQDVLSGLGASPLVCVMNRSTMEVAWDEARGVELNRSPGGVGPAIEESLRIERGGIVYATAMTEAERVLAKDHLVVSRGDNIWVRYIEIPSDRFDAFYHQSANPILWLIQHKLLERLITRPRLTDLIRRDGLRYLGAWLRHGGRRGESVPLSPDVVQLIYPDRVKQAFDYGYRWVNRLYAQRIAQELAAVYRPRLIIHDYHFYLLPGFLRSQGFRGAIELFHHIPWAERYYVVSALPRELGREIVEGMLGANVISFQTQSHARNFLGTVWQLLGAEVDERKGRIRYRGHEIAVVDNPISIDPNLLEEVALSKPALEFAQKLRQKVGGKILIMRADRIDLSKGIPEALEALLQLIENHSELVGSIQFFAALQLSRMDIPQYEALRERVHQLAAKVNARAREIHRQIHDIPSESAAEEAWNGIIESTEDRERMFDQDWPLVVLFEASKTYEEVIGSMMAADIGLINSLVDGMNLVVKELAIVNDPSLLAWVNRQLRQHFGAKAMQVEPAIVVGSTTMGAYAEVKGAILEIEARDVNQTASRLFEAIQFIRQEAEPTTFWSGVWKRFVIERLPYRGNREGLAEILASKVRSNTLHDWSHRLLRDLELAQGKRRHRMRRKGSQQNP